MSKTTSATNKAAKVNLKGMTNPAPATKTTTASRKITISFADQQKEKTWKCKLVLSWTISVKYNENSTTKAVLEMLLGKSSSTSGRQQMGAKVAQPSSHDCPHPKT